VLQILCGVIESTQLSCTYNCINPLFQSTPLRAIASHLFAVRICYGEYRSFQSGPT